METKDFTNATAKELDNISMKEAREISEEQEAFYNDEEGKIKDITLEESFECAQVIDIEMWKLMHDVASLLKATKNGRPVVKFLGEVHTTSHLFYVYSYLNKSMVACVKDKAENFQKI